MGQLIQATGITYYPAQETTLYFDTIRELYIDRGSVRVDLSPSFLYACPRCQSRDIGLFTDPYGGHYGQDRPDCQIVETSLLTGHLNRVFLLF